MKNEIVIKNKGQIEKISLESGQSFKLNNGSKLHLCWGNCSKNMCKHARPSECRKVADCYKDIEKYDFITDGIQGEDGLITVYNCNNYEETGSKELSTEEKRRLKRIKNSLIAQYNEAENVEEAAVNDYMGVIKGHREVVGNPIISEEKILNLISEKSYGEKTLSEVLDYKNSKLEEVTSNSEKTELEKSIKLVQNTLAEVESKRKAKEYAHKAEINSLIEKGIKEKKISPKK